MVKTIAEYKHPSDGLPETTLTWQLSGAGEENLQLVELPRRKPGPNEIAFRTDVNGICFSDVKILMAGPEHPRLKKYNVARDKVVPGHEMSITIVEVGGNVKDRFKVGQRFIVQADMLKYNKAVGYDVWGGFSQYGIFGPEVHEDYLIPIKTDIGYSEAALVEPWACVEASYVRADMGPMDRLVWFCGGGGPMGQMHIVRTIYLKRRGTAPSIETMLLTDISDERLNACRDKFTEMAAADGIQFITLNPNHPGYEEKLNEIAPKGFDYMVALAPIPDVVMAAMKRVKQYGVVNLFAGLKRGTGPITLGDLHYDQITITGNSGSRIDDMISVLRQVEADQLDTNSSAYAVVGIKGAKEGLLQVAKGIALNKVLIYPQIPDLPLTPIPQLADKLPFPDWMREDVRKGKWTRASERVMLQEWAV